MMQHFEALRLLRKFEKCIKMVISLTHTLGDIQYHIHQRGHRAYSMYTNWCPGASFMRATKSSVFSCNSAATDCYFGWTPHKTYKLAHSSNTKNHTRNQLKSSPEAQELAGTKFIKCCCTFYYSVVDLTTRPG